MIVENRIKPALNVRMLDLNDCSPDMKLTGNGEGAERLKSLFLERIFLHHVQYWYWNGL